MSDDLEQSDSIPVLREYNKIRKERKQLRESNNLAAYESTRVMPSDTFSMEYHTPGKIIFVRDSTVRYKRCLFFVASNRWQPDDGLDRYGDFVDFKKWYNKHNHVMRFLDV